MIYKNVRVYYSFLVGKPLIGGGSFDHMWAKPDPLQSMQSTQSSPMCMMPAPPPPLDILDPTLWRPYTYGTYGTSKRQCRHMTRPLDLIHLLYTGYLAGVEPSSAGWPAVELS